jgi:integral membrane protein
MTSPALRRFLWTGRLEAISFLVLVGVAMPVKYLAGQPGAVRVVGLVHGVLFLAYLLTLVAAASAHRWPLRCSGRWRPWCRSARSGSSDTCAVSRRDAFKHASAWCSVRECPVVTERAMIPACPPRAC